MQKNPTSGDPRWAPKIVINPPEKKHWNSACLIFQANKTKKEAIRGMCIRLMEALMECNGSSKEPGACARLEPFPISDQLPRRNLMVEREFLKVEITSTRAPDGQYVCRAWIKELVDPAKPPMDGWSMNLDWEMDAWNWHEEK